MKPNPTALIIDDERAIRRLLRLVLEPQHYKIWEAEDGRRGLQEAVARRPDVIILDLGLPDLDGVTVLKRLREWSQTPVLVLSVRDDETDKVSALDNGANDYMTKPFGVAELLARLRVLRRCVSGEVEEPVFSEGGLEVNLTSHVVTFKGHRINLTATEEALLHALVRHAGRLVTCKHLLRSVWGSEARDQIQNLRVYIAHLRRKLAGEGGEILIKTEGGLGYRLLLNQGELTAR